MTAAGAARPGVGRQVARASLWVTFGMLAGRVAGIVRELLVADAFGATRAADVAVLLITAPDLLVTLAGSGAVGLVLLPRLMDHDPAHQWGMVRHLRRQFAVASTAVAGVIALLVLGFAEGWATAAGGVGRLEFRAAVLFASAAVPFSMIVVLTAAFLRAQDRFAAVSLGTVTFTLPVLVLVATVGTVVGVAIGLMIGAIVRYAVQVGVAHRHLRGAAPAQVDRVTFRGNEIASSFAISVLQAGQLFLPLVAAAVFGSAGDVALVNYGWRVLLIPIGLLASVFSVAAYPTIIRVLQGDGAPSDRRAALRPVIGLPAVLSAAVASWLLVNAPAIAQSLYGPTGLSRPSLDTIADEIRVGAGAVPLITLASAATTILFGSKRVREGLVPYLVATPVLVVASAVFASRIGALGVVWGVFVYSVLFAVVSLVGVRRAFGPLMFGASELAVLASVSVCSWALAAIVRAVVDSASTLALLANGIVFITGCAAVYGVVVRAGSHRRFGDQR